MCLQCVTEAKFHGDPLPGWALYRATKDSPTWHIGDWGLLRCNDPDFVWAGEFVADPYAGMSDDEIEAASEDVAKEFERHIDAAVAFENATTYGNHPYVSYLLVDAAMKAGYAPATHGTRFAAWLVDHVARHLATFDGSDETPSRST